ncbi:MAG: hypothetical protein WCT32_01975 [Patescibacteria group bacterium]
METKRNGDIIFKEERALRVFRFMLDAWYRRSKAFNHAIQPERWLLDQCGIEPLSRREALVRFFYAWLNRSGDTSFNIAKKSVPIVTDYPNIIDPLMSCTNEELKLLAKVIPYGSTRDFERVGWWCTCRQVVAEEYGGDPRNIFLRHGDSRETLLPVLDDLPGVAEKIASLMTLWMQDVPWPEEQERWKVVRQVAMFPVDIWVMRLFRQFDLVEWWPNERKEYLSDQICRFVRRVTLAHGLSQSDLSQALWHTGARICARKPKDPAEMGSHCLGKCPAHDVCRRIIVGRDEVNQNGNVGWREETSPPRRNLFTLCDEH